MKLKLMYFDIAGKAEAIRLALTSAGLPFEDVRFQSRDEFIALKLSGYLRFGQVPALEYTDDAGKSTVLTQSVAILRFVAKLAAADVGLYPEDPVLAALVDGITDQEADAFAGIRVTKYKERFGFGVLNEAEGAAVLAAATAECSTLVIPRHLATLAKQLEAGGTGWLAGTAKPTIADYAWATALKPLPGWCGNPAVFAEVPALVAYVDRFYALPEITAYYAAKEAAAAQ